VLVNCAPWSVLKISGRPLRSASSSAAKQNAVCQRDIIPNSPLRPPPTPSSNATHFYEIPARSLQPGDDFWGVEHLSCLVANPDHPYIWRLCAWCPNLYRAEPNLS
jgi:hypothetical protein